MPVVEITGVYHHIQLISHIIKYSAWSWETWVEC
jgi:hypothetical protein